MTGLTLIEFPGGLWVDPKRIVGLVYHPTRLGWTALLMEGLTPSYVDVPATPDKVLKILSEFANPSTD